VTTSPITQLTLRELRKTWPAVEKVEHRNAHTNVTHDLFGIIDVLAVGPAGTLAVQATSWGHVAARVRKIADSEHIDAIREAGWTVQVWGWRKPAHRWEFKVIDVS
jgi:hypothetical protein